MNSLIGTLHGNGKWLYGRPFTVVGIAWFGTAMLVAFALSGAALATETPSDWHEIRALAELPPQIREALGASRKGLTGIADRGEQFNSTDALQGDLPTRRFILAGVGANRAIVAFEQGGFVFRRFVTTFMKKDGAWSKDRTIETRRNPKTIAELLYAAKQTS